MEDQNNHSFIAWTGRGLEFKLIEPEEVSTTPPSNPPLTGKRLEFKLIELEVVWGGGGIFAYPK